MTSPNRAALRLRRAAIGGLVLLCGVSNGMPAQQPDVLAAGDSVMVRLVDADLRTAAQLLGRYLDRPVIVGVIPNGPRVTVETPRPIPRSEVLPLLRGVLRTHDIELAADSAAGIYELRTRSEQGAMGGPPQVPPPPSAQGMQLFVIRLRHARAVDVAAAVNALYGRGGMLGEIGERPSTLARQLEQQQVPPGAAPPEVRPPMSPGGGSFGGNVTIVPDPRANSLLIRANRGDYALIEAAVQQIDVRPLQVLIEVLIAEVRRDRGLSFGVDVQVPEHALGRSRVLRGDGTLTGGGSAATVGEMAVRVMGIAGIDVEATLRAAASRGEATIISRPVIIAANNEEAEINVGSQRPFVQVSRVLPTDNTARDQVVQYKDVGTRLAVLPTISADGYVMLQVVQEINAATEEQQFNAPVISTRSVETRLLIRDGQTVVLGGLADDQRESTKVGIPFLSGLPLVGGFFGQAKRRSSATELFLFITPRVIREDADADALTSPLRGKAREIEP